MIVYFPFPSSSMENQSTSTAHTNTPWYTGVSECEGVYGGEKHWAVLASGCRGIVAHLEGGMSDEARNNADFIIRACNNFEDVTEALEGLIEMAASVAANWENGNLDVAVRNLVRIANEATTVVAKTKGQSL